MIKFYETSKICGFQQQNIAAVTFNKYTFILEWKY